MTQEETRIYGPLPKPTEETDTHQQHEGNPSEIIIPKRQPSTKKKKIHAAFLTAVVLGIIGLTPIAIIKAIIVYPMTSFYVFIGLVLGASAGIGIFALYTLWKSLYRLIYTLLY